MKGLFLAISLAFNSPGAGLDSFVGEGPYGWRELCGRPGAHKVFCLSHNAAKPMAYTDLLVEALEHQHRRTMRDVGALSDDKQYGEKDRWALPVAGGKGDCEDYVLYTMNALLRAGMPRGQMAIVVGYNDGEGHAALGIRTTAGLVILDNLKHGSYLLGTTSFVGTAIQSETDPNVWISATEAHFRLTKTM